MLRNARTAGRRPVYRYQTVLCGLSRQPSPTPRLRTPIRAPRGPVTLRYGPSMGSLQQADGCCERHSAQAVGTRGLTVARKNEHPSVRFDGVASEMESVRNLRSGCEMDFNSRRPSRFCVSARMSNRLSGSVIPVFSAESCTSVRPPEASVVIQPMPGTGRQRSLALQRRYPLRSHVDPGACCRPLLLANYRGRQPEIACVA